MTVQSLAGQQWKRNCAQKVSPRLFGCGLCARDGRSWDHCHAHNVIRGPLCARCNRLMCDLDAGLIKPDYRTNRLRGLSLCRHGVRYYAGPDGLPTAYETADGIPRLEKYTIMGDDLFYDGRPDGPSLYGWRARCTECPTEQPAVAQWVDNAFARSRLAIGLTIKEWDGACTRCPIVQEVNGVKHNPTYASRIGRYWRERLAGTLETWPYYPHGAPERRAAAEQMAAVHTGERFGWTVEQLATLPGPPGANL